MEKNCGRCVHVHSIEYYKKKGRVSTHPFQLTKPIKLIKPKLMSCKYNGSDVEIG